MTTRNLAALFAPRAITLVGASNEPGSVGAIIARNLLAGGFDGPIWPINPHAAEIQGVVSYRSIQSLPGTPDLAVIATPPATLPGLVEELGARGCRAVVVITAGLSPSERQRMLSAAGSRLMRIVGPNCLGFLSPARGVNASFAHMAPPSGDIAFLTQSGAIATSIIDWAAGRGIGFSHILSLGDMNDVDFGDLLDYLALDAATKSILLYAENVTHARKFMSAARIAARAKPVIVVKAGRSAAGAKAAASHTGALAGADAVYDAAFRRAGMLRVDNLRELFDAAETLARGMLPRGDRLTILTNGGGLGVLAADSLEQNGGRLAPLSEAACAALDTTLPRAWSHANPVDILGDAHGDRYAAALDILAAQPDSDAILVMNCPTGVGDNSEAARALVAARARHPRLPVLSCWMGEATAARARRLLSEAKVPSYETPDEAVRAFLHLREYARNQEALLEAPTISAAERAPDRETARAVIDAVLREGRFVLTEPEAKRVLGAYGVPIVETIIVATPRQAGDAAARIGGPVALKILSRQITHKSDVGGVRLDLEGAEAVEAAAKEMLALVAKRAGEAVIDGFTVQQMARKPQAQELLVGAVEDATFGPCILFAQGGVATEIIGDRIVGLPPLNAKLAGDMIARTRVARLLAGFRDRPPANAAAIEAAIIAVSDLVIDFPEIAELDINPLLADAAGVIALDARIIVRPAPKDAPARLAIRPYPQELTREITIGDTALLLRPVRPEDAVLLAEMARRTRTEDLRLRFHGAMAEMSEHTLSRLTQIDYDREMAMVAVEADGAIAGIVRLVLDPDFENGEYSIIIRSDAQNRGLGRALMREILDIARARGAKRAWGDVLTENHNMLNLARELGAKLHVPDGAAERTRTEFML